MAVGRRDVMAHAAAGPGAGISTGSQSKPLSGHSDETQCPQEVQQRFLEVVFYGLVMLVEGENSAEVVCLQAETPCTKDHHLDAHVPWLRVPYKTTGTTCSEKTSYGTLVDVANAAISFPDLAQSTEPFRIVRDDQAEWPWQSVSWLPDLRSVEPKGSVVADLHNGGGGVVLTYFKITSGTIEAMEPQSPLAAVMSWEFSSRRKAVTDRFLWRIPTDIAPGGLLRLTVTPFSGGERKIEICVPESHMRLELRNMPNWRDPSLDTNALKHAHAYYNILANCAELKAAKELETPKCGRLKSDHWGRDLAASFLPSPSQSHGQSQRSVAWTRTGGSDPICVAMRLSQARESREST